MPNLDQAKYFLASHKITVALVVALLVFVLGGFFVFRGITGNKQEVLLPDIDLNFDPEGPYAILNPRRDGNALVLNIKRVASFDSFSYQLTYTDGTGIDRGAGDLNTWIKTDQKSDYEQELLLGTCSQGFTSGTEHCVFDKGVENGTLTLRIRQGKQPYKMLSQWHLQKPDVALGELSSGDNHFRYKLSADRQQLVLLGYTVVNDLTGVPKLPDGKQVMGKVYSLNTLAAKELGAGDVTYELAETPPADAKIARYNEAGNKWDELDTKVNGSTLTTKGTGAGVYAVLVAKQ